MDKSTIIAVVVLSVAVLAGGIYYATMGDSNGVLESHRIAKPGELVISFVDDSGKEVLKLPVLRTSIIAEIKNTGERSYVKVKLIREATEELVDESDKIVLHKNSKKLIPFLFEESGNYRLEVYSYQEKEWVKTDQTSFYAEFKEYDFSKAKDN